MRMGCCSSGSKASQASADAHSTNGKADNGSALAKPEQEEIKGGAAAKASGKKAPDRGRPPVPEDVPTIGVEARPAGPRPKRKAGAAPAATGGPCDPPAPQPVPTRRKAKPPLLDRSGEPESVRDENEVWIPSNKPTSVVQSGLPSQAKTLDRAPFQPSPRLQKQAKAVDRAPPQPQTQSASQRASWSYEEGVGADPPMLGDQQDSKEVKPQHLLALFSMGGLDPAGHQGHARLAAEEEFFNATEVGETLSETVQDQQITLKDVNMAFG